MEEYNFKKIEKKWAETWIKEKTFTPDLDLSKDPYYALFMFPYPSAEGLHIGNFYAFTCVDVMAKYMKLKGRDVFEPFGFDAFGMHLENYALKIGERPQVVEKRTTDNFRKQVQAAGLSCDYTREVDTTAPEYYKWTQWIFTKLFEKGMAYQKEALLNWCPSCQTVLADEQIEDGVCERCKTVPEKKTMKQWFFKITDYAQRLLDGLEDMDWSNITKAAQKNWIGRSEGAIVKFQISNNKLQINSKSQKSNDEALEVEVFTTRPDTLFGATYFVMSPEHELVSKITTSEQKGEVENYIKKAGAKSELERTEAKEKTGVFTGAYVINPVNNEKIPVWIADYVLSAYGTGAIMAVPAHDERDFEFAKKYDLSIVNVIKPKSVFVVAVGVSKKDFNTTEEIDKKEKLILSGEELYLGDGTLRNSEFLDGLEIEKAKKKTIEWLEEKKIGKKTINYRLRDWCISRQRYWGPPVPIIHCDSCGPVAVPEKDLPVKLPDLETGWEPAGDGRGPLAKVDEFMKVKCPKCGIDAHREPDVMDNFLDSAWYFFRYIDPENSEAIFNKELAKKWLPLDLYVGGNEHAVLHLMYTRFITMAFHDLELIDFDNPFKRFRANGMILKDGKKMSKSKGNVVNPEEYGDKVGYDALKTYLLFLGPLSEDRSFSDEGVQGTKRWVEKIARLNDKVEKGFKDSDEVINNLHKTIKKVTDDFDNQKYNTAVARLMEMTNILGKVDSISVDTWKNFLSIITPFTPAMAEEMWSLMDNKKSIFDGKNWPEYDEKLAKDETIELVIQINGKVREKIEVDAEISEEEVKELAKKSEVIKKWLEGKEIIKEIFVKGKLFNIVIKG